MLKPARSFRMVIGVSILVVLTLAVVGFGLAARAATPEKPATPSVDVQAVPPAQPSCADVLKAADGVCAESRAVSPCGARAEDARLDASASAKPPHRHGYCRCSCGYACTSSADCGGASCDPFITCC
jgi:hypothetical protein